MQYEFAPMEGITDGLFRQLHHQYFPGVDRYYTPFMSPTRGHVFSKRELRELEEQAGPALVPQLLTNRAEDFLAGAKCLAAMGYEEVNLNLGCPSGTVTAKGKGAGALLPQRRQALEAFLDEIFAGSPIPISVKTRLGWADPEEFEALLELYNRYPIRLLTIHPRVRQDLYRNPCRMEWFRLALAESKNPVSLSGGVAVAEDLEHLAAAPETIMLGRGLVADPALVCKLKGGPGADRETLRAFHEELFRGTAARLGSARNTMFRMKELWRYFILLFDDRDQCQRLLRKAVSLTEYQAAVARIFRELPLRESAEADWC